MDERADQQHWAKNLSDAPDFRSPMFEAAIRKQQ